MNNGRQNNQLTQEEMKAAADNPLNPGMVPGSAEEMAKGLGGVPLADSPMANIPVEFEFNNKSLQDYINEGQVRRPVAVKKDGTEIIFYKLDDGTVVNKQMAVMLAEANVIQGVVIGHSKYGEAYIRDNNDGDKSDNLQELPEF